MKYHKEDIIITTLIRLKILLTHIIMTISITNNWTDNLI
jgi:hypothetical protein